jgi:hypothetical protein
MRRIAWGAATFALILVVGGTVLATRGGNAHRVVQPSEVIKAFAARGITLHAPGNLLPAPDVHVAVPLADLSNAGTRGQTGYLVMTVARSLRDADRLDAYTMRLVKTTARDECGRRTVSEDITTFRVDNVVAQYGACDISARPYRLAPASTLADVVAALKSLGRVSSH